LFCHFFIPFFCCIVFTCLSHFCLIFDTVLTLFPRSFKIWVKPNWRKCAQFRLICLKLFLLALAPGIFPLDVFSQFLRSEFSEENIEFWLACEDYRTVDSETKLLSKAKYIYTVFIETDAPKEVRINIDYSTKVAIEKSISQPTKSCFDVAQMKVYSLMQKDSYPRFLHSDIYLDRLQQLTMLCGMKREHPAAAVCLKSGEIVKV
uniref:Regulator of G protein signaling 18 n=1 Tax=Neogobius melanostomus TaxID=47308 RepID=A0A8C6U5V0_9GOBI